MMVRMLSIMALNVAVPAPAAIPACDTPDRIIAASRVEPLSTEPAALGITLDRADLKIVHAVSVRWSGCRVRLTPRVIGDYAFTDTDVSIAVSGSVLVSDHRSVYPPDPEPAHPDIVGARLVGSSTRIAGTARAGLWRHKNGRDRIGVYQPGDATPRPLIDSALPLLGLSYLGAPDAPGGNFTLWQRLPRDTYRVLTIAWREEGIRPEPVRPVSSE